MVAKFPFQRTLYISHKMAKQVRDITEKKKMKDSEYFRRAIQMSLDKDFLVDTTEKEVMFATEKFPVYRECPNCKGQRFIEILVNEQEDTSGASMTIETNTCPECKGEGLVPTGDFAYQTDQGIILDESN